VINYSLRGFRTIFGGFAQLAPADMQALIRAITTYTHGYNHVLSLDEHLQHIGELLRPQIADWSARIELSGPNIPDFLLTVILAKKEARSAFLPVARQQRLPHSRQGKQVWLTNLVRTHVTSASPGSRAPALIYAIWKQYCTVYLDCNLYKFRTRLQQQSDTRRLLCPFLEAQECGYWYGDLYHGEQLQL
jgi:hypothetical protein